MRWRSTQLASLAMLAKNKKCFSSSQASRVLAVVAQEEEEEDGPKRSLRFSNVDGNAC